MAGVVVFIEREGDRPARASLEVLGEGRLIASTLGAPLVAVTAGPPDADARDDRDALGRRGADRVVALRGAALGAPTAWQPHGTALYDAIEPARPLLILMAATPAGRDIAPRLAARLGGAFVAEPSIECGPRGDLVLSRPLFHARWLRRLTVTEIDRPVVATVSTGAFAPSRGRAGDAQLQWIDVPVRAAAPLAVLDETDDDGADLDRATVVVTVGAGVRSDRDVALVRDLAERLGGAFGATGSACAAGLAPRSREVGVGARHVAPRLYVACAASGSLAHLGAVAADAEIVAINTDPAAPIFRVASYGVIGPVGDVVPALIEAVP